MRPENSICLQEYWNVVPASGCGWDFWMLQCEKPLKNFYKVQKSLKAPIFQHEDSYVEKERKNIQIDRKEGVENRIIFVCIIQNQR